MEWYADREVTSKEREAIDEALRLFCLAYLYATRRKKCEK